MCTSWSDTLFIDLEKHDAGLILKVSPSEESHLVKSIGLTEMKLYTFSERFPLKSQLKTVNQPQQKPA